VAIALALAALVGCAGKQKPSAAPSTGANAGAKATGEVGMATWYGKDHHGGPTASGERFDMNALTAAHKKLPMGTRVRVTNLENGRSVVVRINDRGPYGKGRIIDVSFAAARALDMLDRGVVRARVEVLR
jgi:rare lipoprotein A